MDVVAVDQCGYHHWPIVCCCWWFDQCHINSWQVDIFFMQSDLTVVHYLHQHADGFHTSIYIDVDGVDRHGDDASL